MEKLEENEMRKIKAGAISGAVWAIIAAGLSFFGGLLDGLIKLK